MYLIIKREFLTRVKKRSFLLATLLVPLIFPAMIGGLIFLAIQSEKNKEQKTIQLLNENEWVQLENSKDYVFTPLTISLDSAKKAFIKSSDFALIYIPQFDIANPQGITYYSTTSPGIKIVGSFENDIARQLRDIKLTQLGLTHDQLENLKTNISIETIKLTDIGDEKKSDAGFTFGIGYVMGFLIYIFLFAYGSQVMQGVIEEKSSKIVEVIIATVKPFQMMMGKVLGVASVGVFQFLIWILLISIISIVGLSVMGLTLTPSDMMMQGQGVDINAQDKVQEILGIMSDIPWVEIVILFLFYFIGGYLLYGALFAAIGSAVDTPADAQQFMMPIIMPIILALMALFMFVFREPHGSVSVWLSIIPLTSPIIMMGRIGFGVPTWEIAVSMLLLIIGFIFTLWIAGRIYRVGILMHGTKVNYKTLVRWFLLK